MNPDFSSWDDHEALRDEAAPLAPLGAVLLAFVILVVAAVSIIVWAAPVVVRAIFRLRGHS